MSKSISSPNRRTFLKSMGGLIVASGLPAAWAIENVPASPLPTEHNHAPHPSIGAVYNPYYRPQDWNFLSGRRPEAMPLLGSYDSEIGSISAHMAWARSMGLSYFVAPVRTDIPDWRDKLRMLFLSAKQQTFRVALCLDGDGLGTDAGSADTLLGNLVDEGAYLRTPDQKPVLFSIGLRSQSTIRPGGVRVELPESWKQRKTNAREPRRAKEMGAYFGLSLAAANRQGFRKVESRPEQGSRAYSFAFVALSTESDAHDTHLVLPSPDTMRGFDYAIVDGFNNWGYSVPLEPSTRFGRAYAVEIRKWIDQIGEKLA
jgi:hypothetical protein